MEDLIKEKLKKYNQEYILNSYKYLTEDKKEKFIKDIEGINFEQIEALYKRAKVENKIEKIDIKPIGCVDKQKLTQEELNYYDNIGKKVIEEGKYAVVTMAGGQRNKAGA